MSTPVAVVTGAASGIGRALAQQLDSEGYALTLCDVNETGLTETQALLRQPATRVRLDVSKRVDVERMSRDVLERHGRIDLVINNAGVSVDASIAEVDYEDFEWLFGINFWGVVYGTKAFLPAMLQQDAGTIVNISSIFGIIAHPRQATYNASKFAVRGFTETLWRELEGTNVHAVSVHPGGIKTNIVNSARVRHRDGNDAAHAELKKGFDQVARTTPAEAAATIMRGVYEKKKRVLVGADAHLMALAQRLSPVGYGPLFTSVERTLRR